MGTTEEAVSERTPSGPLYGLLLSGKLNDHLSEVDEQAEAMFSQLVKQMAAQDSITEQFKADNQMEWVRQMNSARNRAEEVIYNKLIYA